MKNYLITAGVLGVLVVGLLLALNGKVPQAPLGAVTGPDSFFPCETHNGVMTCFAKAQATLGTTTPCVLKSPNATSTLRMGLANFRPASTSASIVTVAKSSSYNATTTLITSGVLAGSAFGTVVATSTGGLDSLSTFAPNTYFVVGVQGGQGAITFGGTGAGSCQAVWEVI